MNDYDDGNGGDVDLSVSYSIVNSNNLDGDDLEPFAIGIDGEIVVTDIDDIALAETPIINQDGSFYSYPVLLSRT